MSLVESLWSCLGSGGSAGQQEGDGGLSGGFWYLVTGVWFLVSTVWCLQANRRETEAELVILPSKAAEIHLQNFKL